MIINTLPLETLRAKLSPSGHQWSKLVGESPNNKHKAKLSNRSKLKCSYPFSLQNSNLSRMFFRSFKRSEQG